MVWGALYISINFRRMGKVARVPFNKSKHAIQGNMSDCRHVPGPKTQSIKAIMRARHLSFSESLVADYLFLSCNIFEAVYTSPISKKNSL